MRKFYDSEVSRLFLPYNRNVHDSPSGHEIMTWTGWRDTVQCTLGRVIKDKTFKGIVKHCFYGTFLHVEPDKKD